MTTFILAEASMLFMQKQLSQKCNRVNETETVAIFKTLDHTLRFTLHKYKQVIKVTNFIQWLKEKGGVQWQSKKKNSQTSSFVHSPPGEISLP